MSHRLNVFKVDAWSYNHGKRTSNTAILDTGENSTYVINKDLLDNITSPATEHVIVADGSAHPIEGLSTLLGYPSIHADYVPIFPKILLVFHQLQTMVQWA